MTPAEPPSAATVWLRMGTTFETSAIRSPGSLSATAIAARRPAPPPPTTTTSVCTDRILFLPTQAESALGVNSRHRERRFDSSLLFYCKPFQATLTGILPIFARHSAGPLVCTALPV